MMIDEKEDVDVDFCEHTMLPKIDIRLRKKIQT